MQSITILGSTGSIGQSTLAVIARNSDQFKIEALTANRNIRLLYQQCLTFKPRYAAVIDPNLASQLKTRLREMDVSTEVLAGSEAIAQLAGDSNSTVVVAAIVGAAGLLPTIAAVKAGKKVLLANKEALVMAASFFMNSVTSCGATLLPVDSEHNAIFQCLPNDFLPGRSTLNGVQSLILTASGGPFRQTPLETLKTVTLAQAIAHPNWKMGTKISVDSATMMNKGLEVIEAFWLFGLPIERIRVLIHPQSIVHSIVEYSDRSMLAQMGCPDMCIPIAYALAWPNRIVSGAKPLDLTEVCRLEFEPVSFDRFPCLRFAYQALNAGGTATTTLNAANEIAVEAFCSNQITYLQIPRVIDVVMQKMNILPANELQTILSADQCAREYALQVIKRIAK